MSNSQDTQYKTAFSDNNSFYILDVFTSELNEAIVLPLTKKIQELSSRKDATINLYINSRGGRGDVCFHLASLVEYAKAKGITVQTIVTSNAYSSGSILAVTGTPGHRFIAEGAEHCVHYGTHYGFPETTPLQTERNAEHKKRWFNTILEHYQKHCKIPDLENAVKDDSFFIPADKCIKWGLADKYMSELQL